ncbi:MAG: ATP-binding protein [Candidatus Krumholzibacteria bacterium]
MAVRQEKMEFSIPSDFKFLGAVDAAVQDLARELSCGQRWINDFSTALVEACSNAIEHGNQYDKGKAVRVVICLNGHRLIARVQDEGNGFNYDDYLSDATPPDPLSERGRGILIMRAFTDELTFSRRSGGGVCVELVKDCEDGSPSSQA